MTDREKLVGIFKECRQCRTIIEIADKLIANGVTFDEDTNVPTKMKQIKTIVQRRDRVDEFDKEVNSALSNGWKLANRYIDDGMCGLGASTVFYPVFVAELERECDSTNGDRLEEEQATSDKNKRWIPVEKKLPKESDADDDNCVLAIHKATKKRYFHWRSVADNPFDFTHWMPLPEAPKKTSK